MTNEEKYKTPEERINAFNAFCEQHNICKDCHLSTTIRSGARSECVLKWLTLEAKEEKLLPCPFCGGDAEEAFHYGVRCKDCKSSTMAYATKAEAIAAWNRRAV